MDLFGSMAVFVRIVDGGSLAAAARASGISATMAGNHLQTLERRLGTRLINRTTRRQSLTDFGRTYYDRCVEVLHLVADADAQALAGQQQPRGRLRVTAPASFGAEALVPALADYTRGCPEVEIDLSLSDRTMDLVDAGFEAAIRIGALPDSRLIARPLMPYRMILAASPAYLALYGKPATPADLAKHRSVTFSVSARSAWRMTGPEGTVSVKVPSTIQVDSGQAVRSAALNGLGIVMQPEVLLAGDVAAGRLVKLLPGYELPSRPMHIVYLRDRRMTPKLRSFIDFVVERFGPDTKKREQVS